MIQSQQGTLGNNTRERATIPREGTELWTIENWHIIEHLVWCHLNSKENMQEHIHWFWGAHVSSTQTGALSGVSDVRPGPGLAWLSLQESLQAVGGYAVACALSAYTALYSYTRYTYHNSTLKGKCHNTWIDKEHVCPSPWVSPHPLAAEEWVGPCRVWERTHEKDMFTDENPTVGKTRRPEPLSS